MRLIKWLGIIGGLLAAVVMIVFLSGIRIVVIQPIGAVPKGVTAIVSGLPKLNYVDSPDAFCMRENGGVSLLCRGMIAGTIARDGEILFRLPYSETLFRLSGAPDLDR